MDVVIYGSCVTRDTFEFAPPAGTTVRRYIARQSWCSIDRVAETPVNIPKDVSPFTRRSLISDAKGDALRQIRATLTSHSDCYLVMDLADERFGFIEGPEGQIVTYNDELSRRGSYEKLPAAWVRRKFASTTYSLEFYDAALSLEDVLKDLGLWERTAVVANQWAESGTDGREIAPSVGATALMNSYFEDIYSFLETRGWNVLRPGGGPPLSDPYHRWGPAPFHYDQNYYRRISAKLSEFFTESARSSASPSVTPPPVSSSLTPPTESGSR